MPVIHEMAQALGPTDPATWAAVAFDYGSVLENAQARVVSGYRLIGGSGTPIAIIECVRNEGVQKALEPVMRSPNVAGGQSREARHIIRALLNAEDYTSDIYNHIRRVYYANEFTTGSARP